MVVFLLHVVLHGNVGGYLFCWGYFVVGGGGAGFEGAPGGPPKMQRDMHGPASPSHLRQILASQIA